MIARRAIGLIATAAALSAVAVAPASAAPEPQTSLPDIEDEVMCITCGVPLGLATEAPQAIRERQFIRGLIRQGKTKDEIKNALVDEYGENVLATPGGEGFDLAAWAVPGGGILLAAIAIGVGVWRWRRETPGGGDGPPSGQDEDALAPGEQSRLDSDLARYDL